MTLTIWKKSTTGHIGAENTQLPSIVKVKVKGMQNTAMMRSAAARLTKYQRRSVWEWPWLTMNAAIARTFPTTDSSIVRVYRTIRTSHGWRRWSLRLHCKTTSLFVDVEDDQNGLDSARQAGHQQHDGSVVVVQCFFVDVVALGCRVSVALNCATGVHRQHTAVIHLRIRSALFFLFELLSYPEYSLVSTSCSWISCRTNDCCREK